MMNRNYTNLIPWCLTHWQRCRNPFVLFFVWSPFSNSSVSEPHSHRTNVSISFVFDHKYGRKKNVFLINSSSFVYECGMCQAYIHPLQDSVLLYVQHESHESERKLQIFVLIKKNRITVSLFPRTFCFLSVFQSPLTLAKVKQCSDYNLFRITHLQHKQ